MSWRDARNVDRWINDRWKMTVRELSAEARLRLRTRAAARIHTLVAYGAMALIAAVVLGTVSARQF